MFTLHFRLFHSFNQLLSEQTFVNTFHEQDIRDSGRNVIRMTPLLKQFWCYGGRDMYDSE